MVTDFSSALQQTLTNHPLVAASKSDIKGAELDIGAAQSGYYPYLQLLTEARDRGGSETDVSVVQPLFRGGLTYYRVSESKALKDVSVASYRQVQLDLALTTNEAYQRVVASQNIVKAWQDYYARLIKLQTTIKRRVEEGRAARVDIDSVGIRVTQAEAGLAISKSQLFESKSQLQTLTFRDIAVLGWPADDLIIKDYSSLCVTTNCDFSDHPLVLNAVADFDRQDAISKQRRAERFPEVNLVYTQTFVHSRRGDDPDPVLELQLRYQSDADLRGYRSTKAQQARMLSAETRLLSAKRDVALDLISTRSRQQATRVQYGAQQRSLKASQQQVQSFIRQYKAGKKTWLEVLNAEREVHQSQLASIEVLASFWIANTRLYLQGMDWYSLVPANFDIPFYQRDTNEVVINTPNVSQ